MVVSFSLIRGTVAAARRRDMCACCCCGCPICIASISRRSAESLHSSLLIVPAAVIAFPIIAHSVQRQQIKQKNKKQNANNNNNTSLLIAHLSNSFRFHFSRRPRAVLPIAVCWYVTAAVALSPSVCIRCQTRGVETIR